MMSADLSVCNDNQAYCNFTIKNSNKDSYQRFKKLISLKSPGQPYILQQLWSHFSLEKSLELYYQAHTNFPLHLLNLYFNTICKTSRTCVTYLFPDWRVRISGCQWNNLNKSLAVGLPQSLTLSNGYNLRELSKLCTLEATTLK